MRKTIQQIAMILSLFVGISACASQRPVLSSNAQLMRAGAVILTRTTRSIFKMSSHQVNFDAEYQLCMGKRKRLILPQN
jgi:hypothetical protein